MISEVAKAAAMVDAEGAVPGGFLGLGAALAAGEGGGRTVPVETRGTLCTAFPARDKPGGTGVPGFEPIAAIACCCSW